ncbi:uric acid degradation bifunctional protein TTL isoform X2 [Daucus carota subsp. sativus]|uniref:uric acid degradation bifunctional protein TTL isoform X2 n=1 Tax=Daucus carota subsp. sativus TaxID=79200 RepID=UPI0007EF6827|nr:PREDICTED: uric acid degradation bifunctional protein TTL isoform X2 [Daucus carota subsp. sativus]
MEGVFGEAEYLACCGSHKFAKQMVESGPFSSLEQAISAATHIWFNQVDVNGWLEAFGAHPQIGQSPSNDHKSPTSAQWSKGEQSTAIATATDSTLQELYDWNTRYRQKFGFVFLICASGRSTPEILAELKRRYSNRPFVEFEIAAQEQMKITELRLDKLFSAAEKASTTKTPFSTAGALTKAEDRVSIIGSHLTSASHSSTTKPSQVSTRTRPPITTHVLDIARGHPASGIEVRLEMWKTDRPRPLFSDLGTNNWTFQGSSTTDKDGRSGHLMTIVDALNPGIYRISFNTGKYNPDGFFPFVSIVFEIRESQKLEHFHVPLLLSPFSYSTYRGS